MIKLLGKLDMAQNELLHLINMARHPNFVEKLTEILMRNAKNPEKSINLLDQFCSWLSSCDTTDKKHDILLNQTDPESNTVLW